MLQSTVRYSELDDAVRRLIAFGSPDIHNADIVRGPLAAQYDDEGDARLETEYVADWWAFPRPKEQAMKDLAIRGLASQGGKDGVTAADLTWWMWSHAKGAVPSDLQAFKTLAGRVVSGLLRSGEATQPAQGRFALAETSSRKRKAGGWDVPHKRVRLDTLEDAKQAFEEVEEGDWLPAEPLGEFLESWVEEENAEHE